MLSAISLASACNNSTETSKENNSDSSKVEVAALPSRAAYQQTMDGKTTDLYVLKNKNNMQAAITNYGGRLVSLLVSDECKTNWQNVPGTYLRLKRYGRRLPGKSFCKSYLHTYK